MVTSTDDSKKKNASEKFLAEWWKPILATITKPEFKEYKNKTTNPEWWYPWINNLSRMIAWGEHDGSGRRVYKFSHAVVGHSSISMGMWQLDAGQNTDPAALFEKVLMHVKNLIINKNEDDYGKEFTTFGEKFIINKTIIKGNEKDRIEIIIRNKEKNISITLKNLEKLLSKKTAKGLFVIESCNPPKN